jgi:hypothetical protein
VFCKVFWHQTPLVFCHKAPGKTPLVFCSKVPIAISGQFVPCSSGNHFPIGSLPQNTFGILPGVLQQNTKGVWPQNTLQNT